MNENESAHVTGRVTLIGAAAIILCSIYSVYSYNCNVTNKAVEIEKVKLQQILAEHRLPEDIEIEKINISQDFEMKRLKLMKDAIWQNTSSGSSAAKEALIKLIEHTPPANYAQHDNEIKLTKK